MTATIERPATDENPPIYPDNMDGDADRIIDARNAAGLTTELPASASANSRPDEIAILGYEVSWGVPGLLVGREELLRRLTEAGFAEAMPKRPPTPKRALRRAIAEWASGRSGVAFEGDDDNGDINRRRKLIREVRGVAERGVAAPTVLALVEEASLGEALALKYGTSYRFALTPPSGEETEYRLRVSTEGRGRLDEYEAREEERRRVDEEIRPLWERHRDLYTGADISAMLIGIAHGLMGISVESGSGVYSIPAAAPGAEDAVNRLERFVRDLGQTKQSGVMPHFRVRENIDWPRTRRALAEAALDDLASEIGRAGADMERLEGQNAAKPGSVKVSTARGLVQELMRVRRKAEFYADAVGMRQERALADLNKLGLRARELAKANKQAREARIGGAVPQPGQLAMPRSPRTERG